MGFRCQALEYIVNEFCKTKKDPKCWSLSYFVRVQMSKRIGILNPVQ